MKFIPIIPLILFICSCAGESQHEIDYHDNEGFTNQKVTAERAIKPGDSIKTIIGYISKENLKNKSSSFLRYSRNHFFARKGYEFKDSDLKLFFDNQGYYNRTLSQSINLDSTESGSIELLKELEDNYDKVEYCRVIHKFLFNEQPLYYIGWDPQLINNKPKEFFNAGFALLDSSMLWTLKCSTIPPEYLISKSTKFIKMMDDSRSLLEENIEIKNIDEGLKKGKYDEIIIHLSGPSDDYNDVIVGFDSKGEFSILFDEFVTINNISKLNDTIIEFNTTKRCDFIGTMFCDKKYHYNTVNKTITDLPYDFDKIKMETKNNELVRLYSSQNTAVNKVNDSIIGDIKTNTEVVITRFLDDENCFLIESDNLTGWINNDQLYKFEVSFAD